MIEYDRAWGANRAWYRGRLIRAPPLPAEAIKAILITRVSLG
jgi:hypothetical protein